MHAHLTVSPGRETLPNVRVLRWIVAISVILGVLAGLFAIVDRLAHSYARDAVATQVAAEIDDYTTDADPQVEIPGFPFLTQVASGSYDEINIFIGTADVENLTLHDTELTASSVTAPIADLLDGRIHADRLAGSAVVEYDGIASSAGIEGLELSYADGGGIGVRVPAPSLIDAVGVRASGIVDDLLSGAADDITLVGTGSVDVVDDGISVSLKEVGPAADEKVPPLVTGVLGDLAEVARLEIAVPALPYGLEITGLRAEPDGIAVTLTANDVTLTRRS